jgi:hypothetical protein
VNQPARGVAEGVDLRPGSVKPPVRRRRFEGEMKPLPAPAYAPRQALARGAAFGGAWEAAPAAGDGFDAGQALRAWVPDGVVALRLVMKK